mgnify:CR=1 FL=1
MKARVVFGKYKITFTFRFIFKFNLNYIIKVKEITKDFKIKLFVLPTKYESPAID